MKLQDLLRHIAENVENGRDELYGLEHSFVVATHEKIFLYPGAFSLAPRTHVVNGFTVPEPEDDFLTDPDLYYVADVTSEYWAFGKNWRGTDRDQMLVIRGLVHLTKEAAIANAKAMLGIDPYSEGEK